MGTFKVNAAVSGENSLIFMEKFKERNLFIEHFDVIFPIIILLLENTGAKQL
jgi:hypothetical protein